MTFQTIAANAANQLRGEAAYASDEVFITLTARQSRIATRFCLVWISDRGAYFPEDESVRIGSRVYHVEDVHTCERCEDSTVDFCSVNMRNRAGRLTTQVWCDDCQGDNSFYCGGCDERWDDSENHSYQGESYCLECYDNLEREDEVPCYHGARRWSPPAAPCYSFELEVEAEERGELVELLRERAFDKVSWERDGSLSCSDGLEILIQLRDTCAQLANDTAEIVRYIKGKSLGLRSWQGGKCGLHLNSNRFGWSMHSVMRLIFIVRSCKDELVRISGRESNQWASFGSSGHTLHQEAYCQAGKYRALRIGADRMEWRMFRGTLSEKRIKLYCDTVATLEALAQSDIMAHHLRSEAKSRLSALYSNFLKS
jgi:hypothetical protein